MPNLKSAFKRMRTSRIKNEKNVAAKSALKTLLKKTVTAIEEKKLAEAQELLKQAFSMLDKAAQKNLIHKNSAARKKATLASKVNLISSKKSK